MIAIEPHEEGSILPVRAQPGARRNGLGGETDGQLKVVVTQVTPSSAIIFFAAST